MMIPHDKGPIAASAARALAWVRGLFAPAGRDAAEVAVDPSPFFDTHATWKDVSDEAAQARP